MKCFLNVNYTLQEIKNSLFEFEIWEVTFDIIERGQQVAAEFAGDSRDLLRMGMKLDILPQKYYSILLGYF